MTKKIVNTFFIFFTTIVFSQNLVDINDSIKYYTIADTQKSLKFAQKAIQTNFFENDNLESYNTNYLISQVFYFNDYYKETVEYALNGLNIYENLSLEEKIKTNDSNPGWLLLTIGNVYYKAGNNDKAVSYWKKSTESFKTSNLISEEQKNIGYNTADINLALISIAKKDYDEAFNYYNIILNRINDNNLPKSQLILAYNQFMNLHIILDNGLEAENYLDLAYEKFYEIKSPSSFELAGEKLHLIQTIIDYSKYLISKNEIDKALLQLFNVKKNFNTNTDFYSQINILISECYIKSNKLIDAELNLIENFKYNDLSDKQKLDTYIRLSEIYEQIGDLEKLLNSKDSIIRYKNILSNKKNEFINIGALLELDDKQRELTENKIFYNNTVFFLTIVLIILAGIIIIYRANFKLNNEKTKRIKLEKSKIENELNMKKRELFSKSNFILQRNEFLKSILDEINNNDSEKVISKVKKQVSSMVKSENLYTEFDKKFVEVFPEFYKKMNSNYNLSKTDFRLMAYIKMNKSNNEISQISGISLRTVQSQRYRLSKKLKLEKNQDLNSFIFSI